MESNFFFRIIFQILVFYDWLSLQFEKKRKINKNIHSVKNIKTVAIVSDNIVPDDVLEILNSSAEKVLVFGENMEFSEKSGHVDLLLIHSTNQFVSRKFVIVPDCVPRSALSYAELVPINRLHIDNVKEALSIFMTKNQRFGK